MFLGAFWLVLFGEAVGRQCRPQPVYGVPGEARDLRFARPISEWVARLFKAWTPKMGGVFPLLSQQNKTNQTGVPSKKPNRSTLKKDSPNPNAVHLRRPAKLRKADLVKDICDILELCPLEDPGSVSCTEHPCLSSQRFSRPSAAMTLQF